MLVEERLAVGRQVGRGAEPELVVERIADRAAQEAILASAGTGAANPMSLEALSARDELMVDVTWLGLEEPAVVGPNDIHPSLAPTLVAKVQQIQLNVGIATNDTDRLLWRTQE